MKNLFFFTLYYLFTCATYAQTPAKVTWDYPVKPGSEEWKKLKNLEEKVSVCQIPVNVLSSSSIEDLTDICLQYPLLYNLFAFNNMNDGIDVLFAEFNGIRELYKRKHVSKELLKRYQEKIGNLSFLDGTSSGAEKGIFIISISALEVLLSRYQSHNEETKDEYEEIVKNLVDGYKKKVIYAEKFKGFGFQTNLFSRAHVISIINKQILEELPLKDWNSVFFSGMADAETINKIDEFSYKIK